MIGILLAAGAGTRLAPITKVTNKLILPVYNKPMIFYPLQTLLNSGIKDVVIVVGKFGKQIKEVVKEFPSYSELKITYVTQRKLSGMAGAIGYARYRVGQKNIFVIAGDNIFENDFKDEVKQFKTGALSFLRKVKDPHRFGVPIYKDKRLVKIVEKPKNPKTSWIVSGPHFFDKDVFKHIKTLTPSLRGELEITDLNNKYIDNGLLELKKRKDYWSDTGTFDSLLQTGIDLRKLKGSNL